jgi:hypothetical protein
VLAKHSSGLILARTEGLRNGQEIDRVVDGMSYPTYLNDRAKMHLIAEKTRQEYYERLK